MRKLAAIVVILASISIFTGCTSNIVETDYPTLTEQSRKASIQDSDKEYYYNTILELIRTGKSDNADVSILSIDIVDNATIEQIYWSNGSIYIQINNKYMYRFQLNSSNKIESYIKYELEG